MTDYELMNILAEAFANGNTEPLCNLLDEKCQYISDYASTRLKGKKIIVNYMNDVFSRITEEDVYTYEIVEFEKLSERGKWSCDEGKSICAYFIKLHQYGDKHPVAVVYAQVLQNGKVDKVVLSRDSKLFDVIFYKEEVRIDSELDVPKTIYDSDNNELYIWRQADIYMKGFFEENEYDVIHYQTFNDCIGYHCNRRGINYTVYVYAYGREKNISWGVHYYSKLMNMDYSKNTKVLVVYLQVKKYRDERGYRYEVMSFHDSESIELWILDKVGDKKIFRFYPREEMSRLVDLLIYAYNNQDEDMYDWIIEKNNPTIKSEKGNFLNSGFFGHLKYVKEHYGKMKKGYVRYNDLVYSAVPYIEGYGYWGFKVNQQDKIDFLELRQFDGKYEDFIYEKEDIYSVDIPRMKKLSVLPARKGERFVLAVEFRDGKIKRYQLPINRRDDEKEVLSHDRHVFADGIWNSAEISDRGRKIKFSNGYTISYIRVYGDGSDFNVETGEFKLKSKKGAFVLQGGYADGYGVGKLAGSSYSDSLYLFDEKDQLARRLPEEYQGTPIMISPYCGGYSHGLIMVSLYDEMKLCYHHNRSGCAGMWGWIDKNFNVVIKPQFIFAEQFQDGYANVSRGKWLPQENGRYDWEGESWGVIDTTGKEVIPCMYDELYIVDNSEHLYLAHKGGWDKGNYCIVDRNTGEEILQMDFDFDAGYMFNEMLETEDNKIIFVDHQPGEGKDLITVFDLQTQKYLLKQEVYTERTYNGESRVVVEKDGNEIIVF